MPTASSGALAILRVSVGLGLAWWILSSTDLSAMVGPVRGATWLVVTLLGLGVAGTATDAARLQAVVRAQDVLVTFGRGFRLAAASTFGGLVIPGGTGGDLVKIYYLASDHRSRGVELTMAVLADRGVGLFSMLLVITIASFAQLTWLADHPTALALSATAMAGVVLMTGLGVATMSSGARDTWLYRWVLGRIPFRGHVERASGALLNYRRHRRSLLTAIGIGLVGQGVLAAMLVAGASVLLPDVAPVTVVLLGFLGMLANAVPVTPGGLGVGEAAFEALFRMAGVAGGSQLMLLWRLAMLPIALLGAGAYIAGLRSARRESTHA